MDAISLDRNNRVLLKGIKNWPKFEQQMKSVFQVLKVWDVVSGTKPKPTLPTLPESTSTGQQGPGTENSAPKHTPEQLEKYETALEKWEEKNTCGIAQLVLHCEDEPREHLRDIELANEGWALLKKLYGISQLTSVDAAAATIASLKSSSYNSIQEYAAAFKKQQSILSGLGAPMSPIILSAFFRNGLDESLGPYVFQLIQGNKGSGILLDIDTMASSLSEREVRTTNDENKALAARFGKQEKATRARPANRPSASTSRPHSKNPTERKNNGETKKSACQYCQGYHRKEYCWYTNPELAPDGWIPNKEIQERIRNNNSSKDANKKKASAAKTSSTKTSPPLPAEENLHAESQNENGGKTSESDKYVGPGITIKSLRNELNNTNNTRLINSSIHSDPKEEAVYIDTASDVHTMWDLSRFHDYQTVDETLTGIDGNSLRVYGIGKVHYPSIVNGKRSYIELTDVHHVPEMHYNLLSIACLEDKGCYASIKNGRFDIICGGDILLSGTRVGNSYLLDLQYVETPHAFRSSKKPLANYASWDEWHRRLGHLGMQDVKKLAHLATGIDTKMADKLQRAVPPHKMCEDCAITKMTKIHNRIPHRQDPTKRELVPGAKISSDIAGGGQIKLTKGGHRYCASFICEATDMVWIYLMKFKTDLPTILRDHLVLMKTQGHPVRRFTSDNEPIYASKEVQNILREFGIQWEPAEPYTPNQNAIAERTFRTLFGRVRAVLRDAGLSQSYWGEAINYIVYTKNRSPSSVDPSTTPYEAWTKKKADVGNFRPFGCTAYVYDTDPARKKLDNRATKAKFLGYGLSNNQYRFRDMQRKRTFESSWVRWELDSYVDNKATGAGDKEEFDEGDSWEFFTEFFTANTNSSTTPDPIEQHKPGEQAADVTATADVPTNDSEIANIDSDESSNSSDDDVFETPAQTPAQTPDPDPQQAAATPQSPAAQQIAEIPAATVANANPNIRPTRTRVQERPDYRQLHRRGFAARIAARSCKVETNPAPPVPANIDAALSGPDKDKWMAAFQDELNSLEKMVTWDAPAPVPAGRKALPGRWVLAYKLDANNEIARYKARWVVKGFKQIEGLDYNETYSSTVKGTAVRILMALCAKYDYEMEQSDVITAFLESSLTEEVWVEQPHGFTNGNPKDACRLRRALYGLKQSPREWYETIRQFMESLGYTRLVKDHSIFTKDNGMIVAIYVDDILMCAPTKDLIAEFKTDLDKRFRMKHLGDVSWYLGMQIIRDRPNRTIYINQAAYAKRVIAQADMETCYPVASPMEKGNDLTRAPDDYVADRTEGEVYRSLVGELQWLATMTRPDLAFAVGKSGRYSINPTSEHLNSVKRIIKYLAGTTDVGLRYGPGDVTKDVNPVGNLLGWTDSSWSDDRDTSHATSGYVFQLWNGPISWSSKLQSLCTDSTAEAEYVAQCNAAKESLFLSELLQEIGYDEKDIKPIRLMGDNQAAIKLATNPVNHQRTKHIRNKFHFVREMVSETGELTLEYSNTANMVADGMTKAIAPNEFRPFRDKLGLSLSVIGREPRQ